MPTWSSSSTARAHAVVLADVRRARAPPRRSARRRGTSGAGTRTGPGRPSRCPCRGSAAARPAAASAGRGPLNSTSPEIAVRCAVQQPHDREVRDALARAGLADDAERLAARERERDVGDGLHDAVRRREADGEPADVEELFAVRGSRVADSRVDERVEDVDDQVRERDGDGGEQHDAEHDRQVLRAARC